MFQEYKDFLRKALQNPSSVGAIAPSSRALAQKMCAHAMQIWRSLSQKSAPSSCETSSHATPYWVVEIGAGTGAFTHELLRHIPAANLICLEIDPGFCETLKQKFPDITVIQGDAQDLQRHIPQSAQGAVAAVVSGLPIRNFPQAMRHKIFNQALSLLHPQGALVQFTYLFKAPYGTQRTDVAQKKWPSLQVQKIGTVWQNIPPATVWAYRPSASQASAPPGAAPPSTP